MITTKFGMTYDIIGLYSDFLKYSCEIKSIIKSEYWYIYLICSSRWGENWWQIGEIKNYG